ncbi:MAG: hypothetical protein ACJ72N_07845 [Labedaea sp.]
MFGGEQTGVANQLLGLGPAGRLIVPQPSHDLGISRRHGDLEAVFGPLSSLLRRSGQSHGFFVRSGPYVLGTGTSRGHRRRCLRSGDLHLPPGALVHRVGRQRRLAEPVELLPQAPRVQPALVEQLCLVAGHGHRGVAIGDEPAQLKIDVSVHLAPVESAPDHVKTVARRSGGLFVPGARTLRVPLLVPSVPARPPRQCHHTSSRGPA